MKNIQIFNWQMIKESPFYVRLFLIVGLTINAFRSLFQVLLSGRGNLFDFIFHLAGALFVIIVVSLLIELLPLFFLKNRIKHAHIKIFSVAFLILSIVANAFRG